MTKLYLVCCILKLIYEAIWDTITKQIAFKNIYLEIIEDEEYE